MSDPKIDVVVTSYHRPKFTSETILALHRFTETPFRLIVVDNGSDKDTVSMLRDFKNDGLVHTLVLLNKNMGLEPAKNHGLHFVESNMYVDTDNDILVPPPDKGGDWLSKLIKLMEKDEKLVALSCPTQVFIGADKEEMFRDAPEVVEREFVGASMRLMRTAAVRSVGGWRSNPESMEEANRSEEKYICGKLREKGYKVGYARDVEVFHMFGNDGEWGYGDVEHYHRDIWPRPTDEDHGTAVDWYGRYNFE